MCSCNKPRQRPAQYSPPPNNSAVPLPTPMAMAAVPLDLPPSLETVDTSVWGASLWKILHTAAQFSYAREHARFWNAVINALKTGLPCPDCSAHYNAWVASNKLRFTVMTRAQCPVVGWLLNLHNDVNSRTGRAPWSNQQLSAAYGGNKAARLADARALLETLNGIIGQDAYGSLAALLRAL